jgi:ssDNA thymidine ADP-ribosyltransferase, DarT
MARQFHVGDSVIETRYGATQNDTYHGIAGRGQSRKLKAGRILKLTPRFFVSGFDALIQWDDGTRGSRVADQDHLSLTHEKPFRLILGEFEYLYHMTHMQNLASILKHGMLAKSTLTRNRVTIADISDSSVQSRREGIEPIYNRSIHDYVPFYLSPRNPMLYRRKEIQDDIIMLAVSTQVLSSHPHLFTDGNAASDATLFSDDENVLSSSRDVLRASYWSDYEDGKRRKCAEVLVYSHVGPSFIQTIACRNMATQAQIAALTRINSVVDRGLYF